MRPLSDKDCVQAYLDGELPADQVLVLEQRLKSEPRLADLFLTLSREEAILLEWGSAQAAHAELAGTGFLPIARNRPDARATEPQRLPRPWLAAGLVAAGVAAAVVFALFDRFPLAPKNSRNPDPPVAVKPPEQPESVALFKLEDVQGEVFVIPERGDAVPARAGQTLTLGQRLQTRGDGSYAIVALADSTRFDVNGNTTIQLQNIGPSVTTDQGPPGMKVYLEEGTVAADVARKPSDRPMVVATLHAEARLMQSKATFTSQPKGTRIEQERGKVQFTRKSDGRSIDVPDGWYAVAPANASEQFASQPMPRPTMQARLVLKEGNVSLHSAAYSRDGNVLATGAADGSVKFWNMLASGLALPGVKVGGKAPVRAVAYSPAGNLLAVTAEDKVIKLIASATGQEVGTLRGHKHVITCLAFSRDGSLLATSAGPNRNAEVKIWNVEARLEMASLSGLSGGVLALAFADNRILATAGKDGTVKVWDVITREPRHILAGHTAQVNAVAFSPNGALLASAGKDLTIKVWDTATGAILQTFQGMAGEIRSVAFSPDGTMLAAADHSVRLWDLSSGQQRLTFMGHKNAIYALVFAPSGKEVATVGWDKTIRIWDVPAATAP